MSVRPARGFTLLEALMASVVGAIVLGAAFALMTTVRLADEGIRDRIEWVEAFNATQRLARKGMTTLALINDTPEEGQRAAPRFQLTIGPYGQRLEVVLTEPLIEPLGPRPPRRRIEQRDGGYRIGYDDLHTFRGVFEPVPDGDAIALAWQPLPPRNLPPNVTFDNRTLPPPTLIARNLESFEWGVYGKNRMVPTWTAAYRSEMPAYVRLVLTGKRNGLANYLFPLDWADIDEEFPTSTLPPRPEDADDADETQDGENGTGDAPPSLDDQLENFDPSTLDSGSGA